MTRSALLFLSGTLFIMTLILGTNGFSVNSVPHSQSTVFQNHNPQGSSTFLMASAEPEFIEKTDLDKEAEVEEPIIKLDDPLDWKGQVWNPTSV